MSVVLIMVTLGVAVALLISFKEAENPARIPVSRILTALLAEVGPIALLWLTFTGVLTYVAIEPLPLPVPAKGALAFLIGALSPLSAQFVNKLLGFRYPMAPLLRHVAEALQGLTERFGPEMRISQVISMEERRFGVEGWLEVGAGDTDHAKRRSTLNAIHRVFETVKCSVAADRTLRRQNEPPERCLDILGIHEATIKLKLLLRHLGFDTTRRLLAAAAKCPEMYHPDWPLDLIPMERRVNSPDRRGLLPSSSGNGGLGPPERRANQGRRRYDTVAMRRTIMAGVAMPRLIRPVRHDSGPIDPHGGSTTSTSPNA